MYHGQLTPFTARQSMPLFEKDHYPSGVAPDLAEQVNAMIDRLRTRLVKEIPLEEPPTGIRTFNKVRAYLQAHLRRMFVFLDGGHAEYLAGRPLMTELAARSILENVAAVCDFIEKLKPLCDANDFQGIDDLVMKAAFVTRIPAVIEKYGQDSRAPNILGQIDKMVKRVPTFRDSYDHLSDVVHPNGLGAVIYFSTVSDGVITFADDAVRPRRSIELLYLSAVQMAFVEVGIGEIEDRLPNVNTAFKSYAEDFLKRIIPDGSAP